jgi:hypothetical protein
MLGFERKVVAFGGVAALLVGGLFASKASANSVTINSLAGSDSDGAVAASATFLAVNGGIEITITNTEADTSAKGQAVSALSFKISSLSLPTAFTGITGLDLSSASIGSGGSWTLAGTGSPLTPTTVVSDTGSGTIDHWGFSTSGSNVTLATAGTDAPGGNPHYMILPSSGTAGGGKSLADGHFDPYFIGATNFFLTDAAVSNTTNFTMSTFSNVTFGYGTGCDVYVGEGTGSVTPFVSSVPLPNAFLSGAGFLGALSIGATFRRKVANR